MTFKRRILTVAAPLALLALGACATPFKANVSRFQAMPAPAGQSFVIQTSDAKLQGGLEFNQYAALVSQALQAKGYQPAATAQDATLVVNLDYGVDNGQTKIYSRPGTGYFGRPYGGYWGHRYYWGWYDPFWSSPFDTPEIDSYTVFTSHLDMTINRTSDGERVFEGKAKARSTNDSLPKLVPNLVSAMFTNFPGNSGEELKITIPADKKK